MVSPSESAGFPATSEPSALATRRLDTPLNAESSGRRRQIFREGEVGLEERWTAELSLELCCAGRAQHTRSADRANIRRKRRRSRSRTASAPLVLFMKVKNQTAAAPLRERL